MGFEPMVRSRESLVFKTSSINHSDTSPQWLPPECRYYYTKKRRGCQPFRANFFKFLEFYNRDKGRKTLNLTEKYKK